jgi:hypothetical protein
MNNEKKPMRVVNLYAGPGTGKTTTAVALFAELKYRGYNVEYVPEYAKGMTWEKRGDKAFAQQDYIFAKQNWHIARVVTEVDFVITDGPLLHGLVYLNKEESPQLASLIRSTYEGYDNLNVFLERSGRRYNPKGRNQTEEQAISLDDKILSMLNSEIGRDAYNAMEFDRSNVNQILKLLHERKWIGGPPQRVDIPDDWVVDRPEADAPNHKIYIQSNYGGYDERVELEINGNYGDKGVLYQYALSLAQVLNRHWSGMRPWSRIKLDDRDGPDRPVARGSVHASARKSIELAKKLGYTFNEDSYEWEKS